MTRWKKIATVLLLVLPLQGMATSLSLLLCRSDAPEHAAVHVHPHDGNGGGTHEHGGTSGTDLSGHLCCHNLASGMPAMADIPPAPDLNVYEPAHSLPLSLFFPEQLQRPPLA